MASVHDPRLRVFYEMVKARRGEQMAVVALACKTLDSLVYVDEASRMSL